MAKTKIISSEPCEYRDVSCDFFDYQKWFRDEVTYNQALDDLESLVYLLKSAYVGYDDAIICGLEIDLIELFKKSYKENMPIKVSQLSQFICDFLNPYINDSHFCIESKDFIKSIVTNYRVLYSNIYVKKIDDYYVVEKSDGQMLHFGEKIDCKKENLFLYPSEGNNIYRLGVYALFTEDKKEHFCNLFGRKKASTV